MSEGASVNKVVIFGSHGHPRILEAAMRGECCESLGVLHVCSRADASVFQDRVSPVKAKKNFSGLLVD